METTVRMFRLRNQVAKCHYNRCENKNKRISQMSPFKKKINKKKSVIAKSRCLLQINREYVTD